MVEIEPPISRPAVHRALVVAFAVWAAHFMVSYGAALVFPGQQVARWIAIGALVAAVGVLGIAARRSRAAAGPLGIAAGALSIASMVFGTMPAIVG